MRLASNDSVAEKVGDVKTTGFAIGDNAVVAGILRSKIYSNPIRTIVQELTSNARDAHREVGKHQEPISVGLPTNIESIFSVRDFGPGISPDRIDNVFVKYGVSTKRDDDTQTGGFGLGAKSPFSYSDTFSVTTYIPNEAGEMVKRQYVAYLDETEMGSLSLMSEAIEDAPQGTEISVPVKIGDSFRFRDALLIVTEHWDVLPIIARGHLEWPKQADTTVIDTELWKVYKGASWNAKIEALVDGIPYRVVQEHMPKVSKLRNLTVFLKFKAGEMPVTANREELDYQDSVIERLKSLDELFLAEFAESLKKQLELDNTYPKIYNKLFVLLSRATNFNFESAVFGEWLGINVDAFSSDIISKGLLFERPGHRGSRRARQRHYTSAYLSQTNDALVFLNDTGLANPISSVRFAQKTHNKDVLIFNPPSSAEHNYEDIVNYQKLLIKAEVPFLSSIVAAAKASRKATTKSRKKDSFVDIRKLSKLDSANRYTYNWDELHLEAAELKTLTGAYITNYRDDFYRVAVLSLIRRVFSAIELYSIPKGLLSKIDKSKLISFEYMFRDKIHEIESDPALFKAVSDYLSVQEEYTNRSMTDLLILINEYLADTNIPEKVVAEMAVKADAAKDIAEFYIVGRRTFSGFYDKSKKCDEIATLSTEISKLETTHPILWRVSSTSMYDELVDLYEDLRFYLIEKNNRRVYDELSKSRDNGKVNNHYTLEGETNFCVGGCKGVQHSEVTSAEAQI